MTTTILALGALGPQEIILIFLVILLLFGAKKIPELARGVGKGMGEFKKARDDFEHEIKAGEEEGKRSWEEPHDSSESDDEKKA
ncbi:MAG: twin-arginine translocase TatA/TatE family subunit [Verrucomicrobiota bacterium]